MYPIRYPLAQVASFWCTGVKSVSHLEDVSSSLSRQRTLLLSYKDLRKQYYTTRRRDVVLSVSRNACKRDGTNEQNVTTATATAVAVRGDCNAPRLIRPLTNHSVRGI